MTVDETIPPTRTTVPAPWAGSILLYLSICKRDWKEIDIMPGVTSPHKSRADAWRFVEEYSKRKRYFLIGQTLQPDTGELLETKYYYLGVEERFK